MLSEERIKELAENITDCEKHLDFIEFARAIEAECAKLPTFTKEEVEMAEAPWSYLQPAPKVEQQEPVKDEPVAWKLTVGQYITTAHQTEKPDERDWKPLYTRPQPDLTAEVERLAEVAESAEQNAIRNSHKLIAAHQRIAALEEAARQAREVLKDTQEWMLTLTADECPDSAYIPVHNAIAKLNEVLK